MLKIFVDDSGINQPPVYVLGGWLAPADKWAAISAAWDDVLFMSPRIEYFKYVEAINFNGQFSGVTKESRNEKLSLLMGVLEEHNPVGIVSLAEDSVFQGLFGRNTQGLLRHPYFLMVAEVISLTLDYCASRDLNDKVDFVFDVQPGQMRKIIEAWDDFLETCPPPLLRYINRRPSFQDDKKTLAIQAADLLVGRVRSIEEAALMGLPAPDAPWGDRGESLLRVVRVWTPERAEALYEKLYGIRRVRVTYPWDSVSPHAWIV